MIKGMLIMLAFVAVVLGGAFGFRAYVGAKVEQAIANAGTPVQTVSTTVAVLTEWHSRIEAVGNLRAVEGTDLSLELPGLVETILFKSGEDVQAGQLLLGLRADDEIAKLQSLEATAQLAQINFDRDSKQLRSNAVSQAVVDSDAANLKSSIAQVNQQRAVVAKKSLTAPFSGQLGLRLVDRGQYLNAGTAVVTLQSLDPIFVDFFLPQQAFSKLSRGQTVTAKIDTYPDQTFSGVITAFNPKVDISSRNLQVRATLANPDRKLVPGMYATVEIETEQPRRLLTLPQTAVSFNPYGSTVFLVERKDRPAAGQPQLTARQAFVTTGPSRGDQVAILTGIKEGDTVVTAGQLKLREGTPLSVNNSVQPGNNPRPDPKDR